MTYVPSQYTDLHRSFLQIFMNRRLLSKTEALDIFKKIYDSQRVPEPEDLRVDYKKKMEDAVALINKVIARFSQQIRSAEDENTCEEFYVFIFTMDNPLLRKVNRYTKEEITFFKLVVYKIISSDGRGASSIECLNLPVLPKHLTKSDLEDLLDKFCNDLLLVQKGGRYFLSLVSIVELEPVLLGNEETQADKCPLCKHIVLQGYKCDNCTTLVHLSCARRYIRGQGAPTCPKCSEELEDVASVMGNLDITHTSTEHSSEDNDGGCDDYDMDEPGPSQGRRKRKHV